MVTNLGAVPALSLSDLIDDLFSLGDQILQLLLALFLHSGAHRINTERALDCVVFFGKNANLLFCELCTIEEVQLALIQGLDALIVGLCDHAVADFEALIG